MRALRHILSLLALAFFAASCAEDKPWPEPEPGPGPGEDKKIVFTISASSPGSATRGVTRAVEDPLDNEVAIDRLDVFFFDTSGAQLFYPEASQLSHDADTHRVTITIPETVWGETLLDTDCTIYLVANTLLTRTQMTGVSLTALSNLVTANGEGTMFNLDKEPENFLMTGSVAAHITPTGQNLGTVKLRRAAAKIVVDISSAAVDGYVPGVARVRLSNYLDKTRLGSESAVAAAADYKTSEWRTMVKSTQEETPPYSMSPGAPFYSYYNDWSDDTDGTTESYITLEVEWTPEGSVSADPTVYYYRIPFSYIDAGANAAQHKDRLRRNHIYQFSVNLSELGGIDPEKAVDLAANFDVIEWTDRDVVVSILSYHYLFVYNSRVQIHEQASYEWEYRSSIAINDVEISDVSCLQYFANGTSQTVEYEEGDPQYPVITYDERDGKTYFTATSMVPVNYVPLEISLRVSNDAQLFSNVHLTIFPREYVSASTSAGTTGGYPRWGAYSNPLTTDGNGGYGSNDGATDNINFYQITITSQPDRTIQVGDRMMRIMVGDPTMATPSPFSGGNDIAGFEYRQTDPDKNHIISPSFVVASRRGITANGRTWTQQQERCRRYRESQYPAGTWRAPTFAELAMIGDMQNDPNSAIKGLFVPATGGGNGWWTALPEYRIRANQYTYAGGMTGVMTGGGGSIRCVRDTWRVYDQDDYPGYYD